MSIDRILGFLLPKPPLRIGLFPTCFGIIAVLWAAVVVTVNPVGEFMINDDWSYVKALGALIAKGEITRTGWGPDWAPGGPSLLIHLAWGGLFTYFGGFSCTVLRISVLTAGIIGSLVLFMLLGKARRDPVVALVGTLALMLNPLFLSQCFTYMTDVTFTAALICSLYFLYVGLEKKRFSLIVLGLFFSLLSILIRQLGVVIPVAFLVCCMIYPRDVSPGIKRALIAVMITVIVPWFAYEYFQYSTGGTPLFGHQVFQDLIMKPGRKGLLLYITSIFSNFFLVGMLYLGFFCSPVILLLTPRAAEWKFFKYVIIVGTVGLCLVTALFGLGIYEFPVVFWKNVVSDFGIGPILLKDTYVEGIKRFSGIPRPMYYVVLYWGSLSAVACSGLIFTGLWDLARTGFSKITRHGALEMDGSGDGIHSNPIIRDFFSKMCMIAGLLNLGIISASGFHDRYLVPVFAVFIAWIVTDGRMRTGFGVTGPGVKKNLHSGATSIPGVRNSDSHNYRRLITAIIPILVYGFFAVAGTADFMEFKRALLRAQEYLVKELSVKPCEFDGGFEYNGYHCYRKGFKPTEGKSWWWVDKEKYVITLGPLPNYEVVKEFPFKRLLGNDGAVEILKPE